jgi:hypothetical protein
MQHQQGNNGIISTHRKLTLRSLSFDGSNS